MHSDVSPSLLVMTATIKPPAGVIASHRNDPDERMKDYAEALKYDLSDRCRLIDRIVFIDNSGQPESAGANREKPPRRQADRVPVVLWTGLPARLHQGIW